MSCWKSWRAKPGRGKGGRKVGCGMSMPKQMQFKFECASSVPQTAKQGAEAHSSGWEWVEASVWTERMLAALGNGGKGGKWYSLIDKVYHPRTLKAAWKKVAANRGAAGDRQNQYQTLSIECAVLSGWSWKGNYLTVPSSRLRSDGYTSPKTGRKPDLWGYQPSKTVSFRPL